MSEEVLLSLVTQIWYHWYLTSWLVVHVPTIIGTGVLVSPPSCLFLLLSTDLDLVGRNMNQQDLIILFTAVIGLAIIAYVVHRIAGKDPPRGLFCISVTSLMTSF